MKAYQLIVLGLLLLLAGCHVRNIPFIGWRLDVARQQKAYDDYRREYGEDPKTDEEELVERYENRDKDEAPKEEVD